MKLSRMSAGSKPKLARIMPTTKDTTSTDKFRKMQLESLQAVDEAVSDQLMLGALDMHAP